MPETTIDSSAQTDNLQRLLNLLKSEIERCHRYRHSVSVAVVCIDAFTELRKTLSQLATDAVLNTVAGVLKSNLNQKDFCSCLDDEYFIIILSGLSAANAACTTQNIKDKIDSQTISYNWRNVNLTVSIGLASYPMHGNEADKLIASASAAAQFALNGGGNRIVIA